MMGREARKSRKSDQKVTEKGGFLAPSLCGTEAETGLQGLDRPWRGGYMGPGGV